MSEHPLSRAGGSLAWRRTFWVYALLLFIGTHWPALEIPAVIIQRPDLVVHATIFGLWTLLLILSGLAGSVRTAPRTVAFAVALALAYAAIDESLQAVPALHRYAAIDDYLANACGIIAVGTGTLLAGVARRRAAAGDGAPKDRPR